MTAEVSKEVSQDLTSQKLTEDYTLSADPLLESIRKELSLLHEKQLKDVRAEQEDEVKLKQEKSLAQM